MKKRYAKSRHGFTLIEVLIALVGVVSLAMAGTSFLFSILSQRDQAVAESLAAEQSEAVFALIGSAVKSAQGISITNGGKSLELVGQSECWLFSWDDGPEQIEFGRSIGTECSPPVDADGALTVEKAKIERVVFSLVTPDDSSRTVKLEMDVKVYRPLWNSSVSFDRLFVNLVDEGGI